MNQQRPSGSPQRGDQQRRTTACREEEGKPARGGRGGRGGGSCTTQASILCLAGLIGHQDIFRGGCRQLTLLVTPQGSLYSVYLHTHTHTDLCGNAPRFSFFLGRDSTFHTQPRSRLPPTDHLRPPEAAFFDCNHATHCLAYAARHSVASDFKDSNLDKFRETSIFYVSFCSRLLLNIKNKMKESRRWLL